MQLQQKHEYCRWSVNNTYLRLTGEQKINKMGKERLKNRQNTKKHKQTIKYKKQKLRGKNCYILYYILMLSI